MSNTNTHVYRASFPWLTALTVVLSIAKVTGHIAISWFIVFLPALLPLIIFLGVMAVVGIVALVWFLIALLIAALS